MSLEYCDRYETIWNGKSVEHKNQYAFGICDDEFVLCAEFPNYLHMCNKDMCIRIVYNKNILEVVK